MDPFGAQWTTGPAATPSSSSAAESSRPQPQHQLSHRISSLSDFDNYDSFDTYQSAAVLRQDDHDDDERYEQPAFFASPTTAHPLHGRASLVSLASTMGSDTVSLPPPTPPITSGPLQYVSRPDGSSGWTTTACVDHGATTPGRRPSRRFNRRASTYESIAEEDIGRESLDMATLLPNAAPMAGAARPYAALPKLDMTFDMTPLQDPAHVRRLQEQEASGHLTRGLGVGFQPAAQMRESELLAASPTVRMDPGGSLFRAATLRRTFSRRGPYSPASPHAVSPMSPLSSRLGRQGTIKALAQSEANRRGEIVEIIMEDEEEGAGDATARKVDLSAVAGPVMAGDDVLDDAASGNFSKDEVPLTSTRTMPLRKQTTQVFYPQPNWKPFSMRWPYLLCLIVLSAGLGAAEEVIYRVSQTRPLVTFQSPSEINGWVYFAVKFAPTILAVMFGVLWQICDFEVKRLEAFYQMSKETGAPADESINVDYVTYFAFFRPFRALYCHHYAVVVSSAASLLAVSLVPSLSAASVVMTPSWTTREDNPGVEKHVVISGVWSRMLTATFAVIAVLGCVLFYLLQSRRSGLQSDVKGIAGLASMAVVSHILTDFKDMDVATHEDIHRTLRGRRYMLRNASLAPLEEGAVPAGAAQASQPTVRHENHLSQNPHPLMLRAHGCVPYIVGILLFAGLLPAVLFSPAQALSLHAPWLLTALAVCLKLGWGGLETSVRMMEPYYLLSRRHAPAKTLTLDYTAMPFLWVALAALSNGHWLVFFLGFGTVMTELLTVLVASLVTAEGRSFLMEGSGVDVLGGGQGALSFWVTLGMALFILAYMALVALVAFVRRRRPFLPRQPNTIASVLAFIHQSKMLYSFVATSTMSNAAMLRLLEDMGHTYGLGWFEGRDGQVHCGVDEEELTSSYKLGYDYARSNQPWIERPTEWL